MSSGFISESEILEARRRRQEEWEKVRTEDQPQEAPEEPYDTRPLYQRLEEQRLKKEAEYEEAHKLKNMIRGLDDDEVGFLDLVERTKAKAAQQISIEEQREMQEFRERVSNLAESEEMTRLRAQLAPARNTSTSQNSSQKNKLQGIVVRKRKASEMEDDKQKGAPSAKTNGVLPSEEASTGSPAAAPERVGGGGGTGGTAAGTGGTAGGGAVSRGALVVAGVLPGLAGLNHYHTDTSTDTDSSDDDDDKCCVKRDLLGRRAEQSGDSKRKDETKS